MSIDMSQFHQVFLEESFEGLDIMENALMELDPAHIDEETINAIFRAAHSIKGGSATFGFSAIAEFTHVLETLLDQVRAGKRSVSSTEVDLFLQSVDCMREMLTIVKNGGNQKTEKSQTVEARFQELLNRDTPALQAEGASGEETGTADTDEDGIWQIDFKPNSNILAFGNDPARIFSALAELGELEVDVDVTALPALSDLDPETLHLSWKLQLHTAADEACVREVFEWVEDDADISVRSLPSASAKQSSALQWHVHFAPDMHLLKGGNDVGKMFKALAEIARIESVVADTQRLPGLASMDPENCYLTWDLIIAGDLARQDIEEVFEWVSDESIVHIEAIDREKIARDQGVAQAQPPARNPVDVPSVAAPGQVRATPTKSNSTKPAAQEASSIRVGIDKIDNLINMVGELVITQSMLGQLGTEFDLDKIPKLLEGLGQLEQNTRELQESVMRIRMLPISFAFSRFPRMVRDVGQQLNKKIQLDMNGEQTELDKTVMEKIGDPLVHLVRNAIDHGIEQPADRRAAGKPETGRVTLNAYHQGGNVVIEISDDGRGLDRDKLIAKAVEKKILQEVDAPSMADEQVFELIFHPGFSTANAVSDLSGRGVGMDVVRRNIQALNGVVEIQSKKGVGSTIRIRLPLTLAILDGQLVRVGNNTYIFPLVSIVESIQCKKECVNHIAGGCSVFRLRDDYVPIVRLHEVFAITADITDLDQALMVVVEADGEKVGIVVDELLAQQQVVIKSLEQNYRRIEGISGATILGDGTVALILDMPGIVKLAGVDTASKHSELMFTRRNSKSALGQHAAGA